MDKISSQRILQFIFILALASCATGPSRPPKPVLAGQLYEGSYINVRAPASDGWYLASSSSGGMEFGRRGAEQGETFAAQVLMFPLPQTQSEEDFVTLLKKGFEADTNSERFSVLELDFRYSGERSYPCVSVSSVVEDKKAQTSPNRREKLVLQSLALYCRHPVRQETGFGIIYSHRGKTIYSKLTAEAEDFARGVQIPPR